MENNLAFNNLLVQNYLIYNCLIAWLNIEGKSAANLCPQAAALVPDMFCNLNLVKDYKC